MPNVPCTASAVGIEPPIHSIGVWFWRLRPPHQRGIPSIEVFHFIAFGDVSFKIIQDSPRLASHKKIVDPESNQKKIPIGERTFCVDASIRLQSCKAKIDQSIVEIVVPNVTSLLDTIEAA